MLVRAFVAKQSRYERQTGQAVKENQAEALSSTNCPLLDDESKRTCMLLTRSAEDDDFAVFLSLVSYQPLVLTIARADTVLRKTNAIIINRTTWISCHVSS